MGCDIHVYTEQYKTIKSEKKWVNVDFYVKNQYYDESDKDEREKEYEVHHAYEDRNYELFAALAGVRGREDPIIPAKNMPLDVSPEVYAEYIRWGSDGHSHSYLTIAELKSLKEKLGNTIKRSGMISQEQYDELQKGIKPNSWCGWTSMEGWVKAEWEDEGNPVSHFLSEIEKFRQARYWEYELSIMDDNDFRVVFWFDN